MNWNHEFPTTVRIKYVDAVADQDDFAWFAAQVEIVALLLYVEQDHIAIEQDQGACARPWESAWGWVDDTWYFSLPQYLDAR